MKIVLSSIFRDSASYIPRWAAQVGALLLDLPPGDELGVVVAEGDSSDATPAELRAAAAALVRAGASADLTRVLTVNHGGRKFGSVDDAERWSNISRVCNAVLDAFPAAADALVYIESDLIWNPETIGRLLGHIRRGAADVVAPLSLHHGTRTFYDIWGHRAGGLRFSSAVPYNPFIIRGQLNRLDSAGSCLVMRGDVARAARFNPPENGIVGFCGDIRRAGFGLFLDDSAEVYHP